ncbi:DNA polymerase I [Eubacterium ramulus]|uniref:DNA polymerase I n=1 Tax=Eubacterium ramulus ATCC 29099 TaxID=1256908 RepID=U2PGR9_EUBRA|nr:DNA polymerase I [Eubacterium ramulus]ERK43371.1 DNA-directed DNA polymerase [Eubacterium ramulus ATCC 29099]
MSKKIVLIDGHSILNRAFFGVPPLTNSEGLHTNAVYGFLNIMFKILDEEKPDYLTVAFDRSEPTFRHQMFDAYKGTRKPMAQELREQVPVMKEVLQAMGIKIVEMPGYEADDLLGTIAGMAEVQGMDVSIISGDRDLLQLATEKVKIRIPKTKRTGTEIEDYYAADVVERYQVTPKEFIDVKALMGDSSDNIPGVPGIGEKTATNLIVAYKSIENAYAHLEEITPKRAKTNLEEHYDMAQMSKTLATIEVHVPIEFDMEAAKLTDLYTPEAYVYMKRLEFKNMLTRFSDDMSQNDLEKYFHVYHELDEIQNFFDGFSAKEAAVSFFEEAGIVYGLAVAKSNQNVVYLTCGGFVTEGYLEEQVQKLCDGLDTLITPDLKGLLKHVRVPETKNCIDTTIAAYLLNPLKNEYTYDDLARDILGLMVPSKLDLLGKLKIKKAAEEKPEALELMVCYEAYTCIAAKNQLLEQLEDHDMKKLYDEIEMPLVYVLADMEKEGVRAEKAELEAYGAQLTGRISELETSIYEKAGETFNINSPKQLGVILFEKLQMPNGKKTKTGYSTAADVLERLAPDYPIVSEILEYRQLTKLKSTYADGLALCIAPDGRIHSTFNQTITATGRISSTEPNLQNIPIRMELGRLIRKVFVPKEGYVFIDADYSQIELRVLAHMSGDQNLIAAYQHAEDIHRITASQVFHTPLEAVTDLQRRNAKAVNFGIVYGISSFGLSQDLSITRKEAEGYIASYFETYPGIKIFLDRLVTDAKEKGYAETMFGRRRPVPELASSNFMQRSFGERIAMNSPIQGTAADIIKIAMIRVKQRLEREQLKSKLILQVHDELLIEAAADEEEYVKTLLAEEMRHAADLAVTLEVDVKSGRNWFEAH